jgi:16S rRNA (cytidine1402-2'-O)-methyltransferase
VAFESPRRLPASLASLADAEPERLVAVCRELTKAFEEVVTGSAAAVAEQYLEAPRGEVTLVIGPSTRAADEGAALAAVVELVAAGTPRKIAASVVSRLTGVPRNTLYDASLQASS